MQVQFGQIVRLTGPDDRVQQRLTALSAQERKQAQENGNDHLLVVRISKEAQGGYYLSGQDAQDFCLSQYKILFPNTGQMAQKTPARNQLWDRAKSIMDRKFQHSSHKQSWKKMTAFFDQKMANGARDAQGNPITVEELA